MNTLEKTELTAPVLHIERFSKSGIPIYNSEVPDPTGKKMKRRTRRRTQAIAKCCVFHANAIRHVKLTFCIIYIIYFYIMCSSFLYIYIYMYIYIIYIIYIYHIYIYIYIYTHTYINTSIFYFTSTFRVLLLHEPENIVKFSNLH